MIALLQRVSSARVESEGKLLGEIARGLLVLLAVEREDTRRSAEKLAAKVCRYRVFPDEKGKMNLGLSQVGGSVLVVSQFTLAADTKTGLRASFSAAADPVKGEELYRYFCVCCHQQGVPVEQGRFGASMRVQLCNEGPVTFWLTER